MPSTSFVPFGISYFVRIIIFQIRIWFWQFESNLKEISTKEDEFFSQLYSLLLVYILTRYRSIHKWTFLSSSLKQEMVSVKTNPTRTYCQSFDYVGQISVHLGTLDFFLSVTKYNYKEIQFSDKGSLQKKKRVKRVTSYKKVGWVGPQNHFSRRNE